MSYIVVVAFLAWSFVMLVGPLVALMVTLIAAAGSLLWLLVWLVWPQREPPAP